MATDNVHAPTLQKGVHIKEVGGEISRFTCFSAFTANHLVLINKQGSGINSTMSHTSDDTCDPIITTIFAHGCREILIFVQWAALYTAGHHATTSFPFRGESRALAEIHPKTLDKKKSL